MGRWLRGLRRVVTGLSLLLFLAVCVLWVRSYWVGDGFVWKPSDAPDYYRLYVGQGGVRVGSGQYSFDRAPYLSYYPDRAPTRQRGYHPGTLADRLGFDYHTGTDSKGMPARDANFPLWAVALPAALASALGIQAVRRDHRRRRRMTAGQCLACGYDLRASPGRCPECGATANRLKGTTGVTCG